MAKRRPDWSAGRFPQRADGSAAAWAELVRRVLLAALAALFVATPLIPGESPASGVGLMLILLWILLLVAWWVAAWVWPPAVWRWGIVDGALAVFLGWHTLSALVVGGRGDVRAAINLLWLWLSFGVCFFLTRQLLARPRERRAMCAVFASLAVGLSVFGGYECVHLIPARRAQYAADPEGSLREAGFDWRLGSPERKLYEDRLNSSEPSATFALTNSLAGFLAPWLVLAIAVGACGWTDGTQRGVRGAVTAGAILLIGLCLLLTKSRSACLAAGLGTLLVGLQHWRRGRRIHWRVPLAVFAVIILLLAIVVAAGSFDWLVISEAPKSLLYRLQYWRAAAHLIADQPWFGCGPGNFQQAYPAYKLAEASETIADPHNCLMEIGATAGIPALLAFLAIGLALVGRIRQSPARDRRAPDAADDRVACPSRPDQLGATAGLPSSAESTVGRANRGTRPLPLDRPLASGARAQDPAPDGSADRLGEAQGPAGSGRSELWIYAGGVLGVLLAFPCGAVMGVGPELAVFAVILPTACLVTMALDRWVAQGRLAVWMLIVSLIVLFVNLLAAGGISFAGVAQTGWLLAALLLNHLEDAGAAATPDGGYAAVAGSPRPIWAERWGQAAPRVAASVGAVLAVLLAAAYLRTMYQPILQRQVWLATGAADEAEGRLDRAAAAYREAAAADPYSADPWFRLAALDQRALLHAASPDRQRQFEQAVAEITQRNAHSQTAWMLIGDWRLALYRASEDRVQLEAAIGAYAQRVRLYPNDSYAHAQLAWTYHVAGHAAQARRESEEALRLDARNPHAERALARRVLYEPKTEALRGENAEQCLQRLRKDP